MSKAKPSGTARPPRPSSDDAHEIVFFRRHMSDDQTESAPGRDALNSFPEKVRATMRAVLVAVAAAPPNRTHYRLFCILDYDAQGVGKPLLVVVDGRSKPFRTMLADKDYHVVKALGDEYRARQPRSVS